MKIAPDMLALVGRTPMVFLRRMAAGLPGRVAAKLEFFNPAGSVKDRIAANMVRRAEEAGLLDADTLVVEPTSGNTGIGLALACAVKGYKLVLTMPESIDRKSVV